MGKINRRIDYFTFFFDFGEIIPLSFLFNTVQPHPSFSIIANAIIYPLRGRKTHLPHSQGKAFREADTVYNHTTGSAINHNLS